MPPRTSSTYHLTNHHLHRTPQPRHSPSTTAHNHNPLLPPIRRQTNCPSPLTQLSITHHHRAQPPALLLLKPNHQPPSPPPNPSRTTTCATLTQSHIQTRLTPTAIPPVTHHPLPPYAAIIWVHFLQTLISHIGDF
ncbi:hypothetical protein RND81_01G110500 [Saponaria officinalis]|uniref:Uncharacterized protein n=1 Tax=Saponaria officinalis TaxID=3572 RepID=A0AAW1NG48_SAPOF